MRCSASVMAFFPLTFLMHFDDTPTTTEDLSKTHFAGCRDCNQAFSPLGIVITGGVICGGGRLMAVSQQQGPFRQVKWRLPDREMCTNPSDERPFHNVLGTHFSSLQAPAEQLPLPLHSFKHENTFPHKPQSQVMVLVHRTLPLYSSLVCGGPLVPIALSGTFQAGRADTRRRRLQKKDVPSNSTTIDRHG